MKKLSKTKKVSSSKRDFVLLLVMTHAFEISLIANLNDPEAYNE